MTAAPPRERAANSGPRRTLLALVACACAAVPLKGLLSDGRWLGEAWLAMAVVIAPAALLRLRRTPSALDIWPGVILLVPWLTRVYVPDHAWGRLIPTRATFGDIGDLMDSLHRTTSDEVAPIHSTLAVRFVLAALLGLLAALIDLIAVVGRRGALAGVPMLVVYTVSGAVPRSPVAWFWFSVAAVGYLILLSLDASDELREWGRRVSRPGAAGNRPGVAFSAQRIGVTAIVAAVILPLLVPGHAKNLLSDAFRNNNHNGIGGFGAGPGPTTLDPFASLHGQLIRDKPVDLMTVHVDRPDAVPFYVRSNVLDKFTGKGWKVSDYGDLGPVNESGFSTEPFSTQPVDELHNTQTYQATITITGLGGNAPVFSVPRQMDGLDPDTKWSTLDQVLLGSTVSRGDQYVENVEQPQPTIQELEATPPSDGADVARWLAPPGVPRKVTDLVGQLTNGTHSYYERTHAIFDYFTDPKNGFVYSLETTKGDSGNDLVDFLQNKHGFCQQYAAAMAVMLRIAGIPSRVVLGYMHAVPNDAGDFNVTTFDAHAWVEAYFPGLGWIPFDPTPASGLTGGKGMDLPWARHIYPKTGVGGGEPTINTSSRAAVSAGPSSSAATRAGASSGSSSHLSLITTGLVILALIMIGLLPAAVRAVRRRRRLTDARRHGDPDALWAELSDTAIDLGYVWSPARTPRQISVWLARDAADTAPALHALAIAVEERRYAPHPQPRDTDVLAKGLLDVTDQLWSRRSGKVRLQARLWPASLGWGRRWGIVRRLVRRRRH
jgi:transglutaminase-like putative cysteine protease